jgi:hypothetical protein
MTALSEALLAAQRELPTALERNAEGYGYRYTTLDKLLMVARPILAKHGIVVSQYVRHGEWGSALFTRLMTDEEDVELGEVPLLYEPGKMQSLGSAITWLNQLAGAGSEWYAYLTVNDG